jgi:sugar phosphate isomerase/epimerase
MARFGLHPISAKKRDSAHAHDSEEEKMNQYGRRSFLKTGFLSLAGCGVLSTIQDSTRGEAARSMISPAPDPAPPFHLGMVTYNLAWNWDIDTIIKNCETTGFEGVELRTTHKHGVEISISKVRRAEVKKRFADSRVRLVSLGTTCEYQSPNPAVVDKNIEETRRWCELAEDLGCLGVKVRPNGFPKGVPEEKTLEQIGQALAKCGDAARQAGVEIWLEVHGEGTQLPPNIQRILTVANHPALGACWNSNPTDVEGGSVQKSFELLKPWIRSCHITNLEDKSYPWHELFALLRGIGFDRYTLAEIGEPSCEPLRFMKYYRALWEYHAGQGRP